MTPNGVRAARRRSQAAARTPRCPRRRQEDHDHDGCRGDRPGATAGGEPDADRVERDGERLDARRARRPPWWPSRAVPGRPWTSVDGSSSDGLLTRPACHGPAAGCRGLHGNGRDRLILRRCMSAAGGQPPRPRPRAPARARSSPTRCRPRSTSTSPRPPTARTPPTSRARPASTGSTSCSPSAATGTVNEVVNGLLAEGPGTTYRSSARSRQRQRLRPQHRLPRRRRRGHGRLLEALEHKHPHHRLGLADTGDRQRWFLCNAGLGSTPRSSRTWSASGPEGAVASPGALPSDR